MSDYFSKLPIISYANNYARNLLARVAFTEETKNNLTIFYPYTLKESDSRADIVATKYYDDPFYAWLVYLSNDVVDPYYDLGLTQEQFNDFLIKKYGSLESATDTTLFFRTNWRDDESILDLSTFDALPANRKKYYNPVLNYLGEISGYQRKQEDWIVSTNKIIELGLSGNGVFTVGEVVIQYSGTATINMTDGVFFVSSPYAIPENKIAAGIVLFANSSVVTVEKVTGNFIYDDLQIIQSNTAASIVSSVTITSQNIPDDESIYWEAVSAYDYETELNESKREIQLLDNRFVSQVESEIKQLLKNG